MDVTTDTEIDLLVLHGYSSNYIVLCRICTMRSCGIVFMLVSRGETKLHETKLHDISGESSKFIHSKVHTYKPDSYTPTGLTVAIKEGVQV